MRLAILTMMLSAFTACTGTDEPPTPPEEVEIYAIGDSIIAWNRDQGASIPDVVGDRRGQVVFNASVGGARLLGDEEGIPTQYQPGSYDWLIMDGGGNDLGDSCGCTGCDAVLNQMISADATTGVFPEFVQSVTQTGVRVAILGYAEFPSSDESGFDECADEFVELRARQQLLADSDPLVIFVDASEVVSGDALDLFDDDLVHPSVAGGAVMGELLAERMTAADMAQ